MTAVPEENTRLLLRIEEAAERLGIVGRLHRIPAECLAEHVARLRATQARKSA